jgi:predicted nucleotidyltransferase
VLDGVDGQHCTHSSRIREGTKEATMRTLDARAWQGHFTELRTRVLTAFPRLHRQDVEATGDDFDALVHLIQRHSGLSATEVHDRLREIEVTDVDPETRDVTADTSAGRASVDQLRTESGFGESEHPRIVDTLRKLDRQLQRWPADAVNMELFVKDRDTLAQKVTMEVWLPNLPRVVATSHQPVLRDALMEIRDDVWRQIKEQLARRRG